MMTSRSEYRLLLRQDNADLRLTPVGREIGLISDSRWEKFLQKRQAIQTEMERLKKETFSPSEGLSQLLVSRGTSPVSTGGKWEELIRRPQVSYADLAPFDQNRKPLPLDVAEQVEIAIKYEGYIKKQLAQVEQMRQLEGKPLPEELDYKEIRGLRIEAAEKLDRLRPANIGQASRINGVSPADISVLLIWLEHWGKGRGGHS